MCFNSEITGGKGLSGTAGTAGFPHGEIYRAGDPTPAVSAARLYVQQQFALGQESDTVHYEANTEGRCASWH